MTPNIFTNTIKRLKLFLAQTRQQFAQSHPHLRKIAQLSAKYVIILIKALVITTKLSLSYTHRFVQLLAKILRPLNNMLVSVIKFILSLLISLLRYIKSKFDALIYWIILLTEKAIVVAVNTPNYAYRLFLFTEKLIDLLTRVIVFIFKVVAFPVNKILSLLLVIFRYIKSKTDALIYRIILLTEKAIVVAKNTPEYAYRLFLFTEKLIDLLTKVIVFIFKVVTFPVSKILAPLLVILRYIKTKIDSLIYGIILLTEKAITVAENTPEYAYRLFVFTEKLIDLLTKVIVFIFKVVTFPVSKILALLLVILRYIKTKIDVLIYGIILLTEKIIFVAENTPAYLLKIIVFSKDLFVALVRLIARLVYKFIIAIKNGVVHTINFFGSARKKLKSRTNVFILRRKLDLLKLNNKAKQSALPNKLKQYALLIRLDKPVGILLLLWPTLIALWIAAGGWPDQDVLLVFVAGVFLMRSAGCAINDYADRDIDCNVARTKDRPLTTGRITSKEALIIFSLLSIMAFSLVLFMNPLAIAMSFIGVILAASYPFMKRHHYLPQVHLGAAFGWAVPMAYAAQANELSTVTWLLFIATVLWATAYDTMYAMVDREDDLKIGVKSTAILFESADTLIIGIIQALLILCLIMIGQKLELGIFYFTGVLFATGLAVWQQRLIRDREPAQCFKAFLNNNWFGLVLFVGVFLEYQIGDIIL